MQVGQGLATKYMLYADRDRLNDRKAIERMGLKIRECMDLAISTMSAMTFSWGFVHCDPHPGNILVRKHPTKKGKPQIVCPLQDLALDQTEWVQILIDHGLYITLPKKFREEYCTLWRSLFVLDVPSIESIAHKWGIALDANMSVFCLVTVRIRQLMATGSPPRSCSARSR